MCQVSKKVAGHIQLGSLRKDTNPDTTSRFGTGQPTEHVKPPSHPIIQIPSVRRNKKYEISVP